MLIIVYLRGGKVITIYNATQQEKSDLECGMNSLTAEHRIHVQDYIFNGRSIDALEFVNDPHQFLQEETE